MPRALILAALAALWAAPASAQFELYRLRPNETAATSCWHWLLLREARVRAGLPTAPDPWTASLCQPHLEQLFIVPSPPPPPPPPGRSPPRPTDFRHTWGG